MGWMNNVTDAELILSANKIPTSEEIISLIKKVNPTSQNLSELDTEHGYELKGKLQNMLLENYGDNFILTPHPFNKDIVLIKHKYLQSVDACHADIKKLSAKSFSSISDIDVDHFDGYKKKQKKVIITSAVESSAPYDLLEKARLNLENYDYEASIEALLKIRINELDDIPILIRATRLLTDEIGSYDAAISVIKSQRQLIFKNKNIRELLALTYSNNSMIPEARAVFDSIPIYDLCKESLYAYSYICFRDGNLSLAYKLLTLAEDKDGYIEGIVSLRNDIENSMRIQAEPVLNDALKKFDLNDINTAKLIALNALKIYPHYTEARELISIVNAMNREIDICEHWKSLELIVSGKERLALLERLLELDLKNTNKIKQQINYEKEDIKGVMIQDRVNHLSKLAAECDWEAAFKELLWLLRQDVDLEPYSEIYNQTPVFSVFLQNKRLLRLTDQKIRDTWFSLLNVINRFEKEQYDSCLETLDGIKPYFQAYPVFRHLYRDVKSIEQQKSKEELDSLLQQLNNSECSIVDAEKIVALAQKCIQKLALNERIYYKSIVECRLNELLPRTPDEVLLEEFSSALLIGNANKAQQLKEQILDKDSLNRLSDGIDERYFIESTVFKVESLEDITVDLINETNSIKFIAAYNNDVLIKESDNAIIVINPIDLTATLYAHDIFIDAWCIDSLPDKNTYLFRNMNRIAYKVRLEPGDARIICSFDIKSIVNTDNDIGEMLMSSERVGDVYFATSSDYSNKNKAYDRFIRIDIFKRHVKREIVIKSSDGFSVSRLSSNPDRFILEIDCNETVIDKNLATLNKSIAGIVVGYEPATGHTYTFDGDKLVVYDDKLKEPIYDICFTSTDVNDWIFQGDVLGIDVKNKTILLSGDNTVGYLYKNHSYSDKFSLSNIIATKTPSEFFYYELDVSRRSIILRNITDSIDRYVKWDEKATTV